MIVTIDKDKQPLVHLTKVIIEIGESRYRLTESVDGKLTINKHNDYDGPLKVYPRYANEIEVE